MGDLGIGIVAERSKAAASGLLGMFLAVLERGVDSNSTDVN